MHLLSWALARPANVRGVKSRFETTGTLDGSQGQAAGGVGVQPLALQRWQCFIRSTESHLVGEDRTPARPIGAGRNVSVQKLIVNNFNLGRPSRRVRLARCRIRRYFAPSCGLGHQLSERAHSVEWLGCGNVASNLKREPRGRLPPSEVTRRTGCRCPRFEGVQNVSKKLLLGIPIFGDV